MQYRVKRDPFTYQSKVHRADCRHTDIEHAGPFDSIGDALMEGITTRIGVAWICRDCLPSHRVALIAVR